MLSLDRLITDVDGSVARGSDRDRARMLGRVTDLLVAGQHRLSSDQVELFGAVMERFATAIEIGARVELAQRLARLAQAPRGMVAALAHDEIAVARPVLTASPCLDDQALMSVAMARGRDHMLAICERATVSAPVTDVLVHRGDDAVRQAVAGNAGAKLSAVGGATLVDHARHDGVLGEILADRTDLPPDAMRQLIEIAKDAARRRLLVNLPGAEPEIESAVERSAAAAVLGAPRTRPPRPSQPEPLPVDRRSAAEIELARVAAEGRADAVALALAEMTGLSAACVERILDEKDNDLLLVIGKAGGWSWRTVKALLKLRDPGLIERHHYRRAEDTFDGLAAATASRVIQFLKMREFESHLDAPPAGPDRVSAA